MSETGSDSGQREMTQPGNETLSPHLHVGNIYVHCQLGLKLIRGAQVCATKSNLV